MSLDPHQYPNRKDHRKPYYGAKAVSCGCRNHGTCDWCLDNRTIQAQRANAAADAIEAEYICASCEDGWHQQCIAPDICKCSTCESEGR